MTTNGNNLEPEFDALLKSHVRKQGASNVSLCDQFDPETANAYLERELTKNAQARYEEHLVGCSSCRRHIAELARLMPLPSTTAEPRTAPIPLKERLRVWFMNWRWGLLTGLGAVAATVLVLAVIVRRPGQEMLVATSRSQDQAPPSQIASPISSPASETAKVETGTKPMPTAMPTASSAGREREEVAAAKVPSGEKTTDAAPAPPPPAPVIKAEEARKNAEMNEARGTDSNIALQNQYRNMQERRPSGPAANQMQTERALEQSKQMAGNAAGAGVAAPAAKPQERAKEDKDKAVEFKVVPEVAARDEAAAKKSADALEPLRSAKSKVATTPTRGKLNSVRFLKNVGSKNFYLENGIWTDTEYDAEKGLPLVRLQYDSDEYKQTVKRLPALKLYFDLAPVLVVSQGKVYRIEKK